MNAVSPAVPVPVIVTVLPVGLRVTVLVAPAVKVPLLVNDAPLDVPSSNFPCGLLNFSVTVISVLFSALKVPLSILLKILILIFVPAVSVNLL